MKETKENTHKLKHIQCSWTGISIVKISTLSKAFSIISIKILMAFSTEIQKKNPKICMDHKKP